MSAGDYITGPRCLHPLKLYAERTDPSAVCWRRKGHPGNRHLSRWAYLRELRRPPRVRKASRPAWWATS
jgi:hypothetical protein